MSWPQVEDLQLKEQLVAAASGGPWPTLSDGFKALLLVIAQVEEDLMLLLLEDSEGLSYLTEWGGFYGSVWYLLPGFWHHCMLC